MSPAIFVRITGDRLIGLWCDDCDEFVIVYNPQAERSHEVTAGDLHADAERHASRCGAADLMDYVPCICGWTYPKGLLDARERGEIVLDPNPTHACLPYWDEGVRDVSCGLCERVTVCRVMDGDFRCKPCWDGVENEVPW